MNTQLWEVRMSGLVIQRFATESVAKAWIDARLCPFHYAIYYTAREVSK